LLTLRQAIGLVACFQTKTPTQILAGVTGRGVGGDGNVASYFNIAQIKQGIRCWQSVVVATTTGGTHNWGTPFNLTTRVLLWFPASS